MTWLAKWTAMGYAPDGMRRGVQLGYHTLRTLGNTPAISAEVLAYWREHKVELITVKFTNGTYWHIDFAIFDARKIRVQNETKFGEQYWVPVRLWDRSGADAELVEL